MTRFIDSDDVIALRRKFERQARARADATVKDIAPALLGVSEDEARAVLERAMLTLVAEIDEIEREVLRDLDALTMDLKE